MQLLDPGLIQLNVLANDWQSGIRKAAEPLVAQQFITANYPERVIEIAKRDGPYIVIAPQIALSHAAVSDGALKNGLGLTVLAEPVEFGNQANDPVRLIFTLSSVGDDVHLSQMAALVTALQKPGLIAEITKAKDVDEIVNLFK
ncbi:PTS sugar transporter subunit IIA [Lactiplantibacillus fabifermentans T30PCM01]|uniref:Ascorbate-specific PTS system EIIA component n=1 Tax=Lactiplantibacillus fabifermentans T30PCM01 TaxID=1400520 RepID=W6T440_9LACO|nr:PTS sugar transporter subunit IIA [Lactiplantibacillus fabifermentans]ETY72692.1 PTS sugar transporter subunit IIA [Lactiplantibacillus fabifermentans T30PCM01]